MLSSISVGVSRLERGFGLMLARCLGAAPAVATVVVSALLCPTDTRAAIPAYTLAGQYALPGAGGNAGVAWDVGPDGRVWGIVGNTIVRQSAPNASTYDTLGSVAPGTVASFGAIFLRLSPDGSTIALGDNNFGAGATVHFLNTASLSTGGSTPTSSIHCDNFHAAWSGNQLYVSGAGSDFVPIVSRIDASNLGSLSRQTVITGAGLGSGGVAIRGSTLFTAVGFGFAPQPTGQIRSFDLAALSGAPPAAFSSGTFVATILSASPLAFDGWGNLLAGGGDAFSGTSETGYAAVVDLSDPLNMLRLSPAGTNELYGVAFNAVTNELLVTTGGVAYRYAVPSPASAMVCTVGLLLLNSRRRKRLGRESVIGGVA